ncbi:GntR family transcriptional regulator [Ensifer soli]|uniref:GntR family transcriptional regulator n=1 Tax=Ciceribacter sp. sgz301302 TaxID=3342379 RepID=UPI0035B71B77
MTIPAAEDASLASHQIRDALRTAIVEHRLSPGTKLSENDVGGLFNVSRTLVRAALQALSYEGLVQVEKNRGAFVASPTPEEARQIFASRRLIEPGIVREAVARAVPADVERLTALLDTEARLMDERGPDARRAEIKASGDFHLALAAIGGNHILQRFMEELVARSSLVIALYGQTAVSSCGHREHRQIIDAVGRRDADAACALMLHHIDHIEADLDLRAKRQADLRAALNL